MSPKTRLIPVVTSQSDVENSTKYRTRYHPTMFVRRISIERLHTNGTTTAVPIKALDSFSMRNFTNDAVFDDTLPVADGVLEAGHRVPLDLLRDRMEDWLRRKGYLEKDETLRVSEAAQESTNDHTA